MLKFYRNGKEVTQKGKSPEQMFNELFNAVFKHTTSRKIAKNKRFICGLNGHKMLSYTVGSGKTVYVAELK